MTFDDYTNLDKILGQQARAAGRSGEGATAEMAINMINDELNKVPASSNITAEASQLLKTARATAKARFDAIKADPAYKAAVDDHTPINTPSQLADKFVNGYIVNGKTANVANMLRNLSDDPMTQQAIKAGYLDHLRQSSGIDLRTQQGNVSQAGLNKAIQGAANKNKLLLGDDADIVNVLGNVSKWTQEQPRGSYVNNSNTLVGSLADMTKRGVETALNAHTYGTYEVAKGVTQNLIRNAHKPTSVNLKDLGK
jgi:hypothetical protein